MEIKTRQVAYKARSKNEPTTSIMVYFSNGLKIKTYLCKKTK